LQIQENLLERPTAWLRRGLYATHAVKVPSKVAPERRNAREIFKYSRRRSAFQWRLCRIQV